jgi:putative two-component system response regulator
MDGFETLKHLRERNQSIPVVFLTAEEDSGSETRGLNAGAMDFIKKPFVPEVLLTRVRHIIALIRLQNDLESQVQEKTAAVIAQQEKLNRLSIQIVMTLSGAVDAKDPYTNGHSRRVAEYAREIALRYGYSPERAQNIYLIGLLHDIGKIGIPDTIINKPDRLSDEEYELTRRHPEMGCRILENIPDFQDIHISSINCYGCTTGIKAKGTTEANCVHDIDITGATIIYNKVATDIDEATAKLTLTNVQLIPLKK